MYPRIFMESYHKTYVKEERMLPWGNGHVLPNILWIIYFITSCQLFAIHNVYLWAVLEKVHVWDGGRMFYILKFRCASIPSVCAKVAWSTSLDLQVHQVRLWTSCSGKLKTLRYWKMIPLNTKMNFRGGKGVLNSFSRLPLICSLEGREGESTPNCVFTTSHWQSVEDQVGLLSDLEGHT